MSKLDDILEYFRDEVQADAHSPIGPIGDYDQQGAKQQIKDLMLEVFRSCEHDGSFVSVSAFRKKVDEL